MKPRRILGGALTATGLAASILVVAPATQANADWSDCYPGRICLFDGYNGGRPSYAYINPTYGDTYPQTVLIDVDFNDVASSVSNTTGAHFCIYSDWKWQGHWLRIPPGRRQNLNFESPAGHHWSNKTSSFKMVKASENC